MNISPNSSGLYKWQVVVAKLVPSSLMTNKIFGGPDLVSRPNRTWSQYLGSEVILGVCLHSGTQGHGYIFWYIHIR